MDNSIIFVPFFYSLWLDGHHFIIKALVHCYELIPLGGGAFHAGLGEYIINLTASIFIVALKIAAPVIITLFIVNVVMGIVARSVPQMNVFIVGFPLAIGIGFIMIRLSFPFFKGVLIDTFKVMEGNIINIMKLLQG